MEAKKLIVQGAIGRGISVKIFWRIWRAGKSDRYRTTRWIYELPGGVFHEVASHPVYLEMEFLKTLTAASVISKKAGSDLPAPSDELRVLLNGELGLGYVSISISVNPYIRFLNIYGTDMTI